MTAPTAAGHCLVCARFIGPVVVCPYCDASGANAAPWRRLRLAALALATLGLLMLWMAARRHETPVVRIADLRPSLNHSRVCVSGRVVGTPRSGRQPGSLLLTLDDGSGTAQVYAGPEAAPARIPAAGEPIVVSGSVKLNAGRPPILFVRAPEQWRFESAAPPGIPVP